MEQVQLDAFDRKKAKEDNAKYYDEWVRDGKYEKDVGGENYNGPKFCADALWRHLGANLDANILDVGAGTGFVGMELRKKGFSFIDGLDPVASMLEVAKERNVYVNYLVEPFGQAPTSVKESTYDGLGTSGSLSPGHVPCTGLDEMVRVVKPGGIVAIAMDERAFSEEDNFGEKMGNRMKVLEDQEKWSPLEKCAIPDYYFDTKGLLVVFKVTK